MDKSNAYLKEIEVLLGSIFILVLILVSFVIVKMENLSYWLIPIAVVVGIVVELFAFIWAEKHL